MARMGGALGAGMPCQEGRSGTGQSSAARAVKGGAGPVLPWGAAWDAAPAHEDVLTRGA